MEDTQLENVLRKKLVICHKLIYLYGWDDLISTHLSVRIPETDKLLLTPDGVHFANIDESMLVLYDTSGTQIIDNGYSAMRQGLNIHCGVYKNNDSINSIMHTHSVNGISVSSLEDGLMFINQNVLRFYGKVAYHNFNGLALDNEGEEISKSLGTDKEVMILKNHGLLSIGNNIEEAFYRIFYLEQACEIQIKTLSMGKPIISIDKTLCEKTSQQFGKVINYKKAFDELSKLV